MERRALYAFDQPFRRDGTVAGVDESGRGPWAGPVVAAAVILPENPRTSLINDSKRLTAAQREAAYSWIQRHAVAMGIGVVTAAEIDLWNIRQASFAAMRAALGRLLFRPGRVLVDGWPIPGLAWPQEGIVGGDGRSASIAAASIVAKVTRDAMMGWAHRCHPEYGFDRHKGYGTPAHQEALARLGPCELHRRTFAPVRERMAMIS